MACYEFDGKVPVIGEGSFVHENANVVGDVEIGVECFIGSGAVLRGDLGSIRVGNRSNIQDNCTLHVNPGMVCSVGDNCTVGHGAVLHGCTVESGALIGMNAVVSDGGVVGAGSVVAEGAVVRGRQVIPAGKVAAGVPAKIIGDVSGGHREIIEIGNKMYIALVKKYLSGSKRIS